MQKNPEKAVGKQTTVLDTQTSNTYIKPRLNVKKKNH